MSTVATATSNLVSGLQVSGNTTYGGWGWREAILAFLNGVWSGDPSVCNRQKISFNNTVIRLGENGKYYAYFVCEPDAIPLAPVTSVTDPTAIVCFSAEQNDVESGLIRFVRNNQIRHFVLLMETGTTIHLKKGQKRGELHIATYGINSMSHVMQSLGYNV